MTKTDIINLSFFVLISFVIYFPNSCIYHSSRCRDEINYLRTNKPNFAERRTIIDLPEEELSSEKESEDEEKKMEDSTSNNLISSSSSPAEDKNSLESTESTMQVKYTDSEDSSASDKQLVGDVHEVVSVDDSGSGVDDNDTEDETTIDISAADSLSLFKKLLTMTNKTGAPSGTMTLNLANPGNDAEGGENETITPTILQNGRPVSVLF